MKTIPNGTAKGSGSFSKSSIHRNPYHHKSHIKLHYDDYEKDYPISLVGTILSVDGKSIDLSALFPEHNDAGTIALSQPAAGVVGLWYDGTNLMFFDGTNSSIFDYNEGIKTSVFGTPLGDV